MKYKLDDLDRKLVARVRKAIAYEDNGDPAKDAIDERSMIDSMRLLLIIIDCDGEWGADPKTALGLK